MPSNKFEQYAKYARYASTAVQTIPKLVSIAQQTMKKAPGKGKIMYSTPKAPAATGAPASSSSFGTSRKSKEYKKIPKKKVQVNTLTELMNAHMGTVDYVCQKIAENDGSNGAIFLKNIVAGERPFHVWALNTTDRSASTLGDEYPQFILTQNSDFQKVNGVGAPIVVFGNPPLHIDDTTVPFKLLFDWSKIKLQLYGRSDRSVNYTIQVIRLRKPYAHLCPYIGNEEALDASVRLTASQLAERKAFWIDSMLRKQTVNNTVLSGYALNRTKKMYEVIYSRNVEVQEAMDYQEEQNRTSLTISLPQKKMINYNYNLDSRYSNVLDATRVDEVLNTATTDIADIQGAHKPAPHSGLFLIITCNNTVTTTEDATQADATLPSYDISFQCRYKSLSLM